MSYLEFLFVFIASPIAVLLVLQPRLWERSQRYRLGWVAVVAAIAFVYTTPWDNYLVWRGVWTYGTDRVLGTIAFVPIEEYAFFVLQPVLTGLWTLWLVARERPSRTTGGPSMARLLGTLLYALIAVLATWMLRFDWSVYMSLILSWGGVALAGQWAVAGQQLWRRRRLIVYAAGVPTAYLWVADWVAIRDGVWSISPAFTTGFNILGLPIEEAIFFLITNLLVVQGLLLFLPSRAFGALPPKPNTARSHVADVLWG